MIRYYDIVVKNLSTGKMNFPASTTDRQNAIIQLESITILYNQEIIEGKIIVYMVTYEEL